MTAFVKIWVSHSLCLRCLSPSHLACLRGFKMFSEHVSWSKTGVSGLCPDSKLLSFFLFISVLIILPKMIELNRVMKFYVLLV